MQRTRFIFSIFIFCFFSLISFNTYAQSAQYVFRMAGDPIVGDRNGSVSVVEFLDYQCSHCIEMAPVVESVIHNHPGLRVVYKLLPVRGPQSEQAAKAALAANKQGKFPAFNRALLNSNQPLSDEVIFSLAKASGLDVKKLKKDMESTAINNIVNSNMGLASALGIPGTPAFYIGKTNTKDLNNVTSIIGSTSQKELENAIKAAG